MALTLPPNFASDIQAQDTVLVPLIIIGNYPATSDYIALSTNQAPGTNYDPVTLPILLNIPSLKESIDIEKRNYKISSLTLDISNYEYNGCRAYTNI